MNEYIMMIENPRVLFDYYLGILMTGTKLSFDQTIKFEYLKTLFIKDAIDHGDE